MSAEAASVTPWLTSSLVFLGAAVVVVPLSKALGLGSIIGYLAAGLLIGPFGLGLVSDPETILHFAEFGVVLMLFLVGLELEPKRLWALRRPIFGWGAAQVLACAVAIGAVALLAGAPWKWAVVAALGLALSSTAIALQVLGERNLLPTTSGQAGFSILLFQDVAAIPILALIPLLGVKEAGEGSAWIEAARALGVIAAIVLGGRLLLRPLFRWIAKSRTPEIFTAASLLLVVGIAALMQWVGLSMALGAFLGGVLLAESEYKRELETDVEPFKGLLLGLFFIAVGMSVDFDALLAHPGIVFGVLVGFLALKAVVLWALARGMAIPWQERPVFTLLLAQGGEFAFVVFQAAQAAQVFSAEVTSVLIGAVALSMLITPLLLVVIDRAVLPRYANRTRSDMEELSEPQEAPVIVAGFGRYGQIVTRLLVANGIQPTVLELDADAIEVLRRFGFTVYYGDATRLDLLRTAGAEKARVLVVAIDDVDQSLKVVDIAREHFPHLKIVARARNVQHWYALRERGVEHVEREILDASLMTARSVLELMGWEPHRARTLAMRFRRHNVDQLEEMLPHRKDQAKLVSMAKAGRQQLEELFAQDRADREERRREGWGSRPRPARLSSTGRMLAAHPRPSLRSMKRLPFPSTEAILRRLHARLSSLALPALSAAMLTACALGDYKTDPLGALQDVARIFRGLEEMKTVSDIKGSFVFRASELLFPEGLPPSPEQAPTLTPEQLGEVDRFFAARIDAVQSLALRLVAEHPQYREQRGSPSRFARVKFLATGQPHAMVDSDGVLLVDVRVVQAVLRSVIIHWQSSGGLEADEGLFAGLSMLAGPRRFDVGALSKSMPSTDELKAIAAFNAFRREVQAAAPNMEIGMWLKMLKSPQRSAAAGGDALAADKKDKPDLFERMAERAFAGMQAQMAEQSRLVAARYAQETFESALDFLIAHELAHRVFGHATTRSAPAASSPDQACTEWREQESGADEFAAVVLVKRQLDGSRPARIVETGSGWQQNGPARVPAIDGGGLFLSTAYRLAGFGQSLAGPDCSYPPTEERLAAIGLVVELGQEAGANGLHYEGLVAGSWLRAKDNARLAELLDDELPKAYANMPSGRIQRAHQLVGPMLETRFKDRI